MKKHGTTNKKNLLNDISQNSGISILTCSKVMETMLKVMENSWSRGNSIQIPNYFSLKVIHKQARKGTDPRTGSSILIPKTLSIGTKLSPRLKNLLNSKKKII